MDLPLRQIFHQLIKKHHSVTDNQERGEQLVIGTDGERLHIENIVDSKDEVDDRADNQVVPVFSTCLVVV